MFAKSISCYKKKEKFPMRIRYKLKVFELQPIIWEMDMFEKTSPTSTRYAAKYANNFAAPKTTY